MVMRTKTGARLALTVALLSGACAWDEPLVPASEEPFVYLVLNLRPVSRYDSSWEPRQLALLLTVGSPLEAMEYRSAQRFEMRRASDGARFDWRAYPILESTTGLEEKFDLGYANYYLPDSATVAGLGAADLRSGETYELEIETEGVVIRGRVMIPAAFNATVEVRDGKRIVSWPHVAGAGGYIVGAYPYSREAQRDTFYVVPADSPPGHLGIVAVDPNLYRFMTDENLGRSGIDAGFGVIGAISSTSVQLPPQPSP